MSDSCERGAQNDIIMSDSCENLATCKGKKFAAFFHLQPDSGKRIHPKDHHSSRGVQPCLALRIVCEAAREQQPARLSHQCHCAVSVPCHTSLILYIISLQHLLHGSSMHLASSSSPPYPTKCQEISDRTTEQCYSCTQVKFSIFSWSACSCFLFTVGPVALRPLPFVMKTCALQ